MTKIKNVFYTFIILLSLFSALYFGEPWPYERSREYKILNAVITKHIEEGNIQIKDKKE